MTVRTINLRVLESRCRSVSRGLQQCRVRCEMTMDDVFAAEGIHPPNLSRIENGHTNTGLAIVARLCQVYRITISQLFGGPEGGSLHHFAGNVKRLMNENKLTFREAAPFVGIDSSHLNMLSTGVRAPSVETVLRVAYCFGVPAYELLIYRYTGQANGTRQPKKNKVR